MKGLANWSIQRWPMMAGGGRRASNLLSQKSDAELDSGFAPERRNLWGILASGIAWATTPQVTYQGEGRGGSASVLRMLIALTNPGA